jgi:hypothetical protein
VFSCNGAGAVMAAANDLTCVHCEAGPAVNRLGLCVACNSLPRVRALYVRRRGWTPAWEAHLRELTRRAQARLPLFDDAPAAGGEAGR